jgi:hypothetical protein
MMSAAVPAHEPAVLTQRRSAEAPRAQGVRGQHRPDRIDGMVVMATGARSRPTWDGPADRDSAQAAVNWISSYPDDGGFAEAHR